MKTTESYRCEDKSRRKEELKFEDIPEPEMVALIVGNGSGSKVFQAYLDNHEQIYMIPAYPLLYFYPHWESWQRQFGESFSWSIAIDLFCEKHASVLDSRRIPGLNGLTTLGDNQDGYVSVDEKLFRDHLSRIVEGQPLCSKTFLLAVHYAYAMCNGEDLSRKRVLLYHIHLREFLLAYLVADFPTLKVIAMARDPRPNLGRRLKSFWGVDIVKLDQTEAMLNRSRNYYQTCNIILRLGLKGLHRFSNKDVVVVKHENLGENLRGVMEGIAEFLGIDFLPTMMHITFGGKSWWSDPVYKREKTNKFNPEILSTNWQKTIGKIDWFVLEGIMYSFLLKYKYRIYLYKKDNLLYRIALIGAIFLPTKIELNVLRELLHPQNHIRFIKYCVQEASGDIPLKDYTWNATYLFKHIYLDLKLWEPRWYRSIVLWSQRKRNVLVKLLLPVVVLIYVIVGYFRYLFMVIKYPFLIMKRCGLFCLMLIERMQGKGDEYPNEILP